MFRGINRSSRGVVAVVLAGLLSTAACGSDGAADASGGGSGDNTGDTGMSVQDLHTEVTVDVTGDVTVKGSSKAGLTTNNGVDYKSCDQYGGGEKNDEGRPYFVLPRDLIDSIDGKTVFVGVMVKDYQGAGSYDRKTLTDVGSPPGIDFGGTLYLTQGGTTSKVTTDGKGGGSWEFTDLSVQKPDGTHDGGKSISGSVKWTCKE